jgi:hypothetical protein
VALKVLLLYMCSMAPYEWTVVGAGAAGIAAVGRLLDQGIAPEKMAWVDPAFAAGDIGQKWRAVSSNTHAELFLSFFNGSPAFRFSAAPAMPLRDVDPAETCALALVADPLEWVTRQLCDRVDGYQTMAKALYLADRHWRIETDLRELASKNVILAVGAVPKKLSHPRLTDIPVEVALNPEKLAALSLRGANVAVFGSSHSTMIALPHLLRQAVGKVVNFYRSPLRYAVYFKDWIMFDDVGLKGRAAVWARENIDGVLPERLERCSIFSSEFERTLSECDHVIYTIGFERRKLPATPQWGELVYNRRNGILAPGLFGLGIAFPEYAPDRYGYDQYRVGLKKFLDHLDSVLPLWMHYGP